MWATNRFASAHERLYCKLTFRREFGQRETAHLTTFASEIQEASDFKGLFDETIIEAKDSISENNERQNIALGQTLDGLHMLEQFRGMMAKRLHNAFND
jgi:hypothetical protein